MSIGDTVVYNGKECIILWIYDNGNLEIEENSFKSYLVHKDEVIVVADN